MLRAASTSFLSLLTLKSFMFSSVIDCYISANSVCSASNFLLRVSGLGGSSFLVSVGVTISSTAVFSVILLGGCYSFYLFFLFFLISITPIVIIIISTIAITMIIIISRFLSFAITSTVSPS